jgi:hypothetical protein
MKNGLLFIVCLMVFIAAAPAAGQYAVQADRFVSDEPFVGFGAQMNPYLYAAPNWGDVTEENVKELERKVMALAPQHVRIFSLIHWWMPWGDGWIARSDPRMRESFIRTVRLAQDAGASVNLTLWWGAFIEPERSAREFVEILDELLHEHGLYAIQYITLQNEVNYSKITPDHYNRLYRAFDQELRLAGLRDRFKIIGGDLVAQDQEMWFENLAEHQHQILDGYAVHMYWDYWDTEKLLRRVSEVPPIVQSLPAKGHKPLYITEFGIRGHRAHPTREPGEYEDGTPIAMMPLQAMQIGWFMMEAINRGYLATVQWDMYDVWYDRLMPFGVIGEVKDGWPLKPGYHLLRLFTHTAGPGWRGLHVNGVADEALASAMSGPNGEMTVYLLNRGEASKTLSVSGLPVEQSLHVTVWNHGGDGKLSAGEMIRSDADGTITLPLPPMSIVAVTTERIKL